MGSTVRMRSRAFWWGAVIAVACIGGWGCSSSSSTPGVCEQSRALMGTVVTIKAHHPDRRLAEEAIDAAFAEMARVEKICSWRGAQSEVAAVNAQAGGWSEVGPELMELVRRSHHCSLLSDGAFDITVGPVVELWGFEQGGGWVPSPEEIDGRLGLVDFRALEIDTAVGRLRTARPGMGLDLGGVAKGYAVDQAISLLRERGVLGALVDAGGDLRAIGLRPDGKPWRIGIKHPREPGHVLATFELADGSVATSGDYERYFTAGGIRYHHLLDPRTGMPARKAVSATVWASDACTADMWATALFVMGPAAGLGLAEDLDGIDALIVEAAEGGLVASLSSGLAGRIDLIDPALTVRWADAGDLREH